APSQAHGYTADEAEGVFWGVCPSCKAKESEPCSGLSRFRKGDRRWPSEACLAVCIPGVSGQERSDHVPRGSDEGPATSGSWKEAAQPLPSRCPGAGPGL